MTQDAPLTIGRARRLLATGDQRPGGDVSAATLDGTAAGEADPPEPGQILGIGDSRYRILEGLEGQLVPALMPPAQITGRVRAHCGLHKCLTMFQRRVHSAAAKIDRRWHLPWPARGRGYRHFYHYIRPFLAEAAQYHVASVSGQVLDLDSFDDIRVVRFIRDPRDLLVSGYHFHKRGAERINRVHGPVAGDFDELNAGIPEAIAPDQRLHDMLNAVDLETGLMAELAFRAPHYLSMVAWDPADPRVLTVRYEDFLGQEPEMFDRVGQHFGWSRLQRAKARKVAGELATGQRVAREGHIRDKRPGQGRKLLPPAVHDEMLRRWGPLFRAYGYRETLAEG